MDIRKISIGPDYKSSAMHYIDYDDEATLSYLSLMHDGVFGKRYKLEKRPDPT